MRADSFRFRAYMRNPFVHRGLEVRVYDQVPGYWTATRQNKAWLDYNDGKLEQAARGFGRLLQENPERNRHLRMWRALAYTASSRYDSALVDVEALLSSMRREDNVRLVRVYESKEMLEFSAGMLLEAGGKRKEARDAHWRALVENAAFYPARMALGRIALQEGKAEEAVGEFEQAVELAPDDGYLHFQHGLALAAADRHADAVKALSRARDLEPHYADVYLHLAVALERTNARAEAVKAYEQYLERSPRGSGDQADRVRLRLATLARERAAP
jgi:tetratricopeptide (TPR) repeat protein